MNMYFKNDNIIVGLLKNLIKKNTSYHSEGFKVFNEYFFILELDISGFEKNLIIEGIDDLRSDSKWYKFNEVEIHSGIIEQPRLNSTKQKVKFQVLKQNLIEFRDLVLKEK